MVLLIAAVVATLPWQSPSDPGEPLGLADVVTLLETGVADDGITELAAREKIGFRLTPAIVEVLAAHGASRALLRELTALQETSAPPAPAVVVDHRHRLTFALPPNWRLRLTADGGRFERSAVPDRTGIDVTYRVMTIRRERLDIAGIDTLDALHRRRIDEVVASEGRMWKYLGTWPLAACGWSGVHTVFEDDTRLGHHVIRCLTWYSRGDAILSFRVVLDAPRGASGFDLIVDEVTRILVDHAPERLGAESMRDALLARDSECLYFLRGDGSIVAASRRPGVEPHRVAEGGFSTIAGSETGDAVWAAGRTTARRLDRRAEVIPLDENTRLVGVSADGRMLVLGRDTGRGRMRVVATPTRRGGGSIDWSSSIRIRGRVTAMTPDDRIVTLAPDDRVVFESLDRHRDAMQRSLKFTDAVAVVADARRCGADWLILGRKSPDEPLMLLRVPAVGDPVVLWRRAHPSPGSGTIRATPGTGELLLCLEGDGIRALPARGGLPVQLADARDVAVAMRPSLPGPPVVSER